MAFSGIMSVFGVAKPQISERLLNVAHFHEIQTASESVALLKHAIEIVKNDDYVEASLYVAMRLTDDKSKVAAGQLGDLGVCSIVDAILGQKMQSVAICKVILTLIVSLMSPPEAEIAGRRNSQRRSISDLKEESANKAKAITVSPALAGIKSNRKRLSNSSVIYKIIKACASHCGNMQTLHAGLLATHILVSECKETSKLASCGACEMLCQVIRTHPLQEDLVVLACQSADLMIRQDIEDHGGSLGCQDKFGENFLCELLAAKILQPKLNPSLKVASCALQLVGSLGRRSAGMKDRLAAVGLCESIVEVSKTEFVEDAEFAEALCWCLANIAFPSEENQTRLGHAGACVLIKRIMERYVDDVYVIQEACRALHQLAAMHDGNLSLFTSAGAPAYCMELLRRYDGRSDLLQWVMYAIAALSESDITLTVLNEANICQEVVSLLNRHVANEDLVQWASVTIVNLTKDRSLAELMHQHHCSQILIQALVRHMGSADVTEELLRAIGCISATLPSTRSTLVENSIGDFVMKALEQNMQCDSVVEQGFYALSRILAVTDEFSLENDHVALQQVAVHKLTKDERRMFMSATYGLLQNNAMKLIAKLSFKHSEDSSVLALYTVQVIASLLIGAHLLDERSKPEDKGGSNKSAADSSLNSFGSGGACAVLCALLTKYRQDASIVFWCLFGLTHLSTSLTLVNLMRSSDVSSLLVHVLEIYLPSNKGIVNMCFEIITNLCIDPNCRGILGNALYKGTDNSHIVLSSLRYHFHDARVVASACKAINALCFSPAEDAYSSLFEARKGADNVKMRSEVEENSATPATRRTSGSVSSASEWSSFSENTDHLNQVIKMEESGPSPQDSAGQDSSDASSSGATSLMKRLSVLRWIGKAGDEDSPSGTGQPTSRSNPTISANYEQSLNVVQEGGNLIMDAAKALISTGLSDQEEKMILALKQRTSQRKNSNDALVECGCFVVLKQIFTSYSSNNFVLIQAVNALNSLALHPANRIKIKDSSVLLEALVAVYAAAVEKYTWDYLKDLWDTSTHDMLESDWNRVLVILCSITLGTVCLQEANKANSSEASREMQIAAVRANQLVLENLSVLNTMCSALSKGSKDVPLCEALLRAFHLVVANNEANQQKVGEMLTTDEYNVLFLIVQILREKMEVPRVAYYACAAIASIASGHEANSAKFNDFGVCKLVLRVLSRYMDYEEVVEAACQAVFGLKLLNDTLGQGGACEYVLQALTLHPSSSAVAEWVCRAIGSLAESKFNKIEFEKHQVAKVITSTLQRHVGSEGILSAAFTKDKSSAGVAQWGCTAIYYLAKGYDAESFQRRLVSVGACEAVAKALMKYAEVESVAYSCCRALVVLVDGNEALRSKPVLSGVCQYVVESLHLFPSSVLMAKWGCRAAAVLAESHEANIAKLGAAGACESIPLIIQSHPNSEHVAVAGCKVIAFMSEQTSNGFAARFGHAGACEAVVGVLRKHMESPSAAARACIAINTLAMVGGNARWFGPAGVCDVLQSALVLHINDLKVAKFIIAAIGQLCVIEHNKERLGSLGICETVVQAAVKHVADLDTAQSCADTIGKLCETIVKNTSVSAAAGTAASASKVAAATYSSVPVETLKASSHFEAGRLNRAVLFSCGACEFLVSALDHHLVHVSAAYCISRAVYLVSQGEACFQERERLGQLGACQAVTKALLYHEGNEEVAMYGCYAVQALALDSEHNKHVLNEAGVCPVVVQTLRGYRHSPTGSGATEAAGRAINNMSMGCAENKLSLGSAGACEGLLEVLELFNRSVDLTLLFVKALFNVCDGNSINRVKISFSGAGDILHAVLQRYIDEERVVDYVLSILIGMSMDKVGQSKLGTAGVPKTLAVLAGRYEKTSEHILVLLVVLIGVMARNSRANQEKLAQSGAFKIILSALARHSAQQGSSSLGSRSKLTGMMVRSKTLTTITSSDSFYDNSRSRAPTSTSVDLGISGEAPQDSLLRDDGDASEALLPSKQIGDTSLLEYMEEVSMVKEACRATFYLCYEHEENKKRATVAGVLDILTAIVSNSSGTAGDMLQSTQDQQKLWAKNAMELLMISS